MKRSPEKKNAAGRQSNAANFKCTLQSLDATATGAERATAALTHALATRLQALGLPISTADGDSIVIAGQSFDLRAATAYARQLGRAYA